jgi:glycine cleavage system transcriptional repressor
VPRPIENRCAVVTSRLSRHGETSALVLQVGGSWDALARLEGTLPGLAKKHGLTLNVVRSADQEVRPQALPYVAYVSAPTARTSSTSCASSSSTTASSWKP